MCLISKIQCDEPTGIRLAVPARRLGVPWGTRKQARGGDFEAPSGILMLLSFAVSQTTPMASMHATQVWFGDMKSTKQQHFWFSNHGPCRHAGTGRGNGKWRFQEKKMPWEGTEPLK